MSDTVLLDGSSGEGGGQILRTALTLSLLTGKAFCIERIRANRRKPGLRPQHLEAVRAAARIGGAQVEGARVDSERLAFSPEKIESGRFDFEIPTAGCAPLVLQTAYLLLALQPAVSRVTVTGGTHVAFAPCYDYLTEAWLPALQRLGLDLSLSLRRCGFYPRGGGGFEAEIPGIDAAALRPIDWTDRGKLLRVTPVSMAAQLPISIAERQAAQADRRLRKLGLKKRIRNPLIEERSSPGPGTMLGLRCEWENARSFFFSLGARGKSAEKVADEAVDEFAAFHLAEGCPVDPHLADQLLLPLAMISGTSTFRVSQVTGHLTTNAQTLGRFLDRPIRIDGEPGRPAVVVV